MQTQSLENELQTYLSLLSEVQKASVLNMIKSFFSGNRVSMEEYNEEIEAAETRIKNGEFTTQQQFESDLASWKTKNLR